MADEFPYKELFPFKSQFVDIEGHRMHYVDEGSGPVVICVHGNPTWSFYYRDLIKALKKDFRVIALDHIGCGLSARPHGFHFTAKDRARHLELLIEHLKLKSYSFVMHDWGGSIATFAAIKNLNSVEKLIYFNTTLTETEILPWFIKISAGKFPGKFITRHTKIFLKLATDVGVSRKLPKQVRQGYLYPYKTRRERDAIWDFVQDIPFTADHPTYQGMLDISRALGELSKKPVQIIWGLRDPCFHQEMLTHMMRLFPHAEVVELPDASHLVLEDAPELICDKISTFLKRDVKTTPIENSPIKIQASNSQQTLFKKFISEVKLRPHQKAVIIPKVWGNNISYSHITYSDMHLLVARYQRGLSKLGLKSGDKVLFLVTPGIDFLALAYAVMAEGAVPVFIDPGIEKKHLFQALADIKPDVFIGIQKAHLLRLLKPRLFKGVRFHVVASDWSIAGGPSLAVLRRFTSYPEMPPKYNEVVMVAFTSGATGVPKGVIFTQEMVLAQLELFNTQFGIKPGGIDLPLLPIFSLYQLAGGVTSVIPPLDPAAPLALDPSIIVKIIKDLGITYSFGSPTLWRKIAEYCVRVRTTLPTIKKVFMAGTAVPLSTVKLVQEALEGGEVYTPYGATEALPVTIVTSDELITNGVVPSSTGEIGVYVGRAVGGPINNVEVKIISPVDGQIENIAEISEVKSLTIGEIIVRGQNVSSRYLNRSDADQKGKIKDGSSVWHRMGDMGYLDENGGLYYCGRKDHIVHAGKKAFHSVPIEEIFNTHPQVARSALVSLDAGEPAIVVEPKPEVWSEIDQARDQLIGDLTAMAGKSDLTKEIQKFFINQSFPVDRRHNAKIYRDRLGIWASQELKSNRSGVGRRGSQQ